MADHRPRRAHPSSFCWARGTILTIPFFPFSVFRMANRLHRHLAPVFKRRRRTTMGTAALKIIWRNPKAPQRQYRWEQTQQDSRMARYMVHELVPSAEGPFWLITSSLELVSGGRVA